MSRCKDPGCNKELVQKPGELTMAFIKRVYCDRKCVSQHRADKLPRSKVNGKSHNAKEYVTETTNPKRAGVRPRMAGKAF